MLLTPSPPKKKEKKIETKNKFTMHLGVWWKEEKVTVKFCRNHAIIYESKICMT